MVKAVIPSWEDPIFRFLGGLGELTLNNEEGQAFSLWEALVYFKDDDYPLEVNGREYSKDDLIFNAKENFEGRFSIAKGYLGSVEALEKLKKICNIQDTHNTTL